jgi:hypothetical protein
MQELNLLLDNEIIPSGSVIRLYEVGRFDIMNEMLDRNTIDKEDSDFYEYMVVDYGLIKDNTFYLINITRDNSNRGSILCEIDAGFMNSLTALRLVNYFGKNRKVLIELNR